MKKKKTDMLDMDPTQNMYVRVPINPNILEDWQLK